MTHSFEIQEVSPGIELRDELANSSTPIEKVRFVLDVCNRVNVSIEGEQGDAFFNTMTPEDVDTLRDLMQRYVDAAAKDRGPIQKQAAALVSVVWERV